MKEDGSRPGLRLATRRRPRARQATLFGGMRIRKKLIILHTAFSLALGAALLLLVRPAVTEVVEQAELRECRVVVQLLAAAPDEAQRAILRESVSENLVVGIGSAEALGLDPTLAGEAQRLPGEIAIGRSSAGWPRAAIWDPAERVFYSASARQTAARSGVAQLYGLLVIAVVGVYILIAAVLEVFVLPREVYQPIRRVLEADKAVQSGDRARELIPKDQIAADELGEIMRSRNESVRKLRRQEEALADALERLEVVANDLRRKNHLLETARRNMADQDRLASLGMMSAGLAHELNTPLAVLKGCVERLRERDRPIERSQVDLMWRVVTRLERLSESLLDFARVRSPSTETVDLRQVLEEAWTLVRLDREVRDIELRNETPSGATVQGDSDRFVQVFVNLLRNAADAMNGSGQIHARAEHFRREERDWVSITIADNGPGIDPEVLPRLFEPFTTTRLDSRGTGLGLAVAEGIVREHHGLILARNRPEGGSEFEVMLPVSGPPESVERQAEMAEDVERSASS